MIRLITNLLRISKIEANKNIERFAISGVKNILPVIIFFMHIVNLY